MQVYLIYIFGFINPYTLAQFLNSKYQIRNWYQYGNIIAILSIASLTELQTLFMPLFFGQTFIIMPALGSQIGGNMPAEFWKFVNNPHDAGVWPPLQIEDNLNNLQQRLNKLNSDNK